MNIGINLDDQGITVMNGHFILSKELTNRLKTIFTDAVTKQDPHLFYKIEQECTNNQKSSIEPFKELANANPTVENYQRYIDLGRTIIFPWCLGALFAYRLDETLLAEAQKEGIAASEVSSLIQPVDTLLIQQQKQARVIKQRLQEQGLLPQTPEGVDTALLTIQSYPTIRKEIQAHVVEYGWIEMANFVGETLTPKKLLEQLLTLPHVTTIHHPSTKPSSPIIRFLVEIAKPISTTRQLSAELFSMFAYQTRPFLQKIAEKLGLDDKDILSLTPEEVLQGLKSEKQDDLKKLAQKRRDHGYVITSNKQEITCIWDEIASVETLINQSVPKANSVDHKVKGVTAHPGSVQGRANVIISVKDFHKMKDGDILVTTMTTPDFVLLMQRASAIVTDIGGLLSHAAIVSRELKKPCVIGTKFATQLFKDGDLLEVDATNGMVTRLTR